MVDRTKPGRTARCALAATAAAAALTLATEVGAADLEKFGRCLRSKRATFYGAAWCPQCRTQREQLGTAMQHVTYVECAIPGRRDEQASACRDAEVTSYPTWTFGDGTRARGRQSLERLAARTGCALPGGAARAEPRPARTAAAIRPGSRTKIIEVR